MPKIVIAVIAALLISTVAEAAADATLFRLYLADGSSVVSFGEFARVADRVVFSMPIGGPVDQPRLQVVTLPVAAVDWSRTDRYADSARYQRYADTRGEDDFLQLTSEVARVLNGIATTTDRTRALAYAEQARRSLADWPGSHYGYRQRDVREVVSLIDESISDLRASLGISSFNVALVAIPAEAPREPLLGMPGVREQFDQMLHVSGYANPAERIALLRAAVRLLGEADSATLGSDVAGLRRNVEGQIREEERLDSRYGELSTRMMAVATRAAAGARTRDIERVLDQIPREDERLGRRRPDAVDALLISVRGQLDAARRLRLMRDQWTIRRALYRDYERTVGAQLLQLVKSQPALESIRRLDGPSPGTLINLRGRLSGGAARLSRVRPPNDLGQTHDMLVSAWRFAETALNARYDAIQSGNFATAREASSSAAGALLMLSRAQQEIRALLEPPRLR